MNLSPSEMNTFKHCPFQWKLWKIDGVKRVTVENYKRDFGINMHEIIKQYYGNIKSTPTPKKVEEIAWSCFKGYFNQSLSEHQQEAESALRNFIKFEQNRLADYHPPVMIETHLRDVDYNGILDMFDGFSVYDWKFGTMTRLEEEQLTQGKIYTRLLNSNGYAGQLKVVFVTLINGRLLEMPRVTDNWLAERRNRMCNMIEAKRFPKIRSKLCEYCDFQLCCEFSEKSLWDGELDCLTL